MIGWRALFSPFHLLRSLRALWRRWFASRRGVRVGNFHLERTSMPSITSPINPQPGQTLGFELDGIVPAGATFVEPTVTQSGGPTGTIAQTPSVLGTAASDGSNTFTTGVSFTAGDAGSVTLGCSVLGVDDTDVVINVVAPPPSETVSVDPNSFVIVTQQAAQAGTQQTTQTAPKIVG
jgi:hypothetical protein